MRRVLGSILCDLDPEINVIYSLENASPPKPVNVAASHFAGAYVT